VQLDVIKRSDMAQNRSQQSMPQFEHSTGLHSKRLCMSHFIGTIYLCSSIQQQQHQRCLALAGGVREGRVAVLTC
jgi:hypothetical protein